MQSYLDLAHTHTVIEKVRLQRQLQRRRRQRVRRTRIRLNSHTRDIVIVCAVPTRLTLSLLS